MPMDMVLDFRVVPVVTVNVDDGQQAEKLAAVIGDQKYSFPLLRASDDVAGIYNIVFRQMFDRHRDLSLPTSFLLDGDGDIVKIYQGRLDPERGQREDQHQDCPRARP